MISHNNIEGLMLGLAASIGANTGCNLFNSVMPLFVEKLNCSGAMVIRCAEPANQVVSVDGISSSDQKLLLHHASTSYTGLNASEPFKVINGELFNYHNFLLPGYGLLVLHFIESPKPVFFIPFLQLVSIFSGACLLSEKLLTFSAEKEDYSDERNMLHAIIQNIPDPVYVKDIEGRKILLNKAEAELLGVVDIDGAIGKKDSDFFSSELALKMEAEDRQIIKTGQAVIHKEGLLTTLRGKDIWLQGTKVPHFDEQGKIAGIIGISHNISGFKKIESELRVVAEKYQAIFTSFLDLYFRSDLKGIILELSPSSFLLSGYKPQELIGTSAANIYSDKSSRERMIGLLAEKEFVNDFENQFVHKSGKLVPVSITCHMVKDTLGKPGYIEGTIRDITERKETEAKMTKLINLQNLLTHLATEFINIPVENSNEAVDRLLSVIGKGNDIDRVYIFEYDFDKNTMSNTHEWCAKGISPEKANLQQIPNALLPSWVEAHKKGEKMIVPDINKLDKKDPQYVILEPQGIQTLITIPLILRNECLGFVGFDSVKSVKQWSGDEITFLQLLADLLCNVSDRKKTDVVLRNREASLKAVFNNVPFQMWLKDTESRYLAVNRPFMDYFSIASESDVIGKTAYDLWDNNAASHFIEQDKMVMNDRQLSSVEELIDFKHKTAWFEIFRAPIVNKGGQLLGTTGIARDITSRKVANKALQQAVDAAEAANLAKSKFLAIMSHEIRNPLNAVVGMVRMLQGHGLTGPNSKLVENIKTSSDHLLMIINDVLDFSKIESGEMLLEHTSFNLQDVVKRVFNSHTYIAKEKQVVMKYHIDKRLAHLHKGDPLRLQQVLGNLTNNALKFTPAGKIEIRVLLEAETAETNRVRFEVEDSGIGISAENQEKIFESFKQADDTISRTHGGTGLGLAISKQIVELMGGKLNLESTRNVGSKFYFSIDMQTDESQNTEMPAQDNPDESTALLGHSALLVEDNKLNQILAIAMLEKWGLKVKVAGNGQQAVDILAVESFDIILMDIQMPVMDGVTASKMIREKLHVTTPILALSANVIKGIVEKCEEAGMQGYISKPFEAHDLFRKIVSHVTKNKTNMIKPEIMVPDVTIADVSRLEKMIGPDPVQLNKMISKFLEITPSYVAELNNADSANDLLAIASASHKIKSSIDLVSTAVMCELIMKINQDSRKGGDISDIKPLIARFNQYYKILEKELKLEVHALKSA